MVKENVSLDSSLKNNETRNYLLYAIKHNDLMSKKHKNIEHFLVFVSDISGCLSIFYLLH